MAQLISLGIHTPVALPYLISEGLLPPNAGPQDYQWEIYVSEDRYGGIEEEVLTTKRSVAWSQGAFVRNVYRFDLEEDDITQALLTNFPDGAPTAAEGLKTSMNGNGASRSQDVSAKLASRPSASDKEDRQPSSSRALVVFLKSKAYIYFLHGTNNIVDLPFEVERAFSAPRGLVIQRKSKPLTSLPPTPVVPSAPPNSFFSSQLQPGSSILQSPSIAKSFASTQASRFSPRGIKSKVDELFQNLGGTPTEEGEDDLAGLYSLTNPLADVGAISYSIQQQRPRLSSRSQSNLNISFEPLDATEEIIYVSRHDELGPHQENNREPLTFIVTANKDTSMLTVWHAWYLSEKSLSALLKQRAAAKSAKARRRSSFISAGVATGATTPAVRNRDGGARESLATTGPVRAPGDNASSSQQTAAPSARRKTRQEEEEVMASQMDPDYQPSTSQQAAVARESRRISSLNADTRGGQHQTGNSFAGNVGRRNTSFGGVNERRSLGHRKSRGSTPGSVLNRSLGPEDDSMDLDTTIDGDEDVDSIVGHIRATAEAEGAEGILGPTDDSFKRDIVVRKMHSFPSAVAAQNNVARRVFTLRGSDNDNIGDARTLDIYVHEDSNVICLHVLVRSRPLYMNTPGSPTMPIPVLAGEKKHTSITDIVKLKDYHSEAVVFTGKGLIVAPHADQTWPIPSIPSYRRYRPNEIPSFDQNDIDVGRNRTLQAPSRHLLRVGHPGTNGRYAEFDEDGVSHRLQTQLQPTDRLVQSLLEACELVLPRHRGKPLTGVWQVASAWLRREPQRLDTTAECAENVAFVAAILALALPLVDEKTRAALRMSVVAAAGLKKPTSYALRKMRHVAHWSTRTAWSNLQDETAISPRMTLSPRTKDKKPHVDQLLAAAAALAEDILQSEQGTQVPASDPNEVVQVMLALHIVSEDAKLCSLNTANPNTQFVAPLILQLGSWLGAPNWTHKLCPYYDLETDERWAMLKASSSQQLLMSFMREPVGVYHWFEHAMNVESSERYPTLDLIACLNSDIVPSKELQDRARRITPRLAVLSDIVASTSGLTVPPIETVELMGQCDITAETMETLPEAIAAPFKDAIARCEKDPPTTWSSNLLTLVGRDDLTSKSERGAATSSNNSLIIPSSPHDVQTVCHALDHHPHTSRTKEASRHAVSQLIFHEDRRLVEATSLMHYNSPQIAECVKQPDWTDAQYHEQQRRVMQYATTRTIALPAGDAMLHFDSQNVLLTDKYHLMGFNASVVIQPTATTLTVDRSGLTEDKVGWAFFHAGASAGLRISKNVEGIDTSWIAFNKPSELTNRHAGLLLALGLSGHLRQLAKWLSFKYLTPKHSMTSVGLLLGLSASYMGTMDTLITRMLSVHITRMLPPGAAELNVSPITQTAGLVGIGLLYYNTQHRRMSEMMLSEIEHMEMEDPDSGPDPLRDESYRLAAGIALGFINLGKGKDLYGLHGMFLPERLLAVAVGPRPVSAVHVFDKATAGAVIAIALVYMKSGDESVARKIDIPDNEAQFEHVRPDMLTLRAMAKHLILWHTIEVNALSSWIRASLPACYKDRLDEMRASSGKHPLRSSDVPFFNIATGLALALSFKYAGSGNTDARDEILDMLDCFYMVKGGAEAHYYDAKLTRSTVRRCIDALALAATTVMAGTGDVRTFRYLRRLHGRTDAETPYGSHFAAHLAIGTLFLGGGTFTFGTTDLAIASLICAFYPLYPMDVHDNHVHLQALRHLWVFAVEARCLVIEETDTKRPISMPIIVTLKDGSSKAMNAPCLLPELESIATVHTDDPAYWRATLDFENNPGHLSAFRQNQRVFVRRCPASEAHSSIFSTTLTALGDVQSPSLSTQQIWHSVFELPAFKDLDKSSIELILPPDVHSAGSHDERGTVVDDKLVLAKAVESDEKDALWNLRMLFAWAEKAKEHGREELRWIGREVVETLKAKIEERSRES